MYGRGSIETSNIVNGINARTTELMENRAYIKQVIRYFVHLLSTVPIKPMKHIAHGVLIKPKCFHGQLLNLQKLQF